MRADEFISERVNPDTLVVGFKREKTLPNGFIIRAETRDLGGDPAIFVRIFDPASTSWVEQEYGIADAKFVAGKDAAGNITVHSISTGVTPAYRRKGLATEIYKFMRELGNDISPAKLLTRDGQAMWQGFNRTGALAEEPQIPKLNIDNAAARAWIDKVYAMYPQTFQNNHVMIWGKGEDRQFAMFELVPSVSRRGAVEVKWFQAHPLRQGVGTRAMQELQRLAQADGISLTLYPWDKGQVSQSKLMKFYKGRGFKPAQSGSKNLAWSPDKLSKEFAKEEATAKVMEVNSPGELAVDPDLIKRFTDQGWAIDGEGRDQIVLSKPGSRTVLKIVGQGNDARQDVVRRYVNFFRAHQRNPHFPRVGVDKTLRWKDNTYYVYTQERLLSLPGDEAVMDYLEQAMAKMGRGEYPNLDQVPAGLTAQQVDGLVQAVDQLYGSGQADQYEFDLGNVANIMQRANGQLVIVDPLSDFMSESLEENFADDKPIIDMLEEGSLQISSWLEENPRLLESDKGWHEIESLFKKITGDQPKVGKKYAVLNLVAVPPGQMLLQQGSMVPATLVKILDQGSYQQYEFDANGRTIRYPEDHRAGDRLSRTFLFQDPAGIKKAQTVIALSLGNWDIRNRLNENFADGKKPGRKGLSRRVGIPRKATLGQLEKIAKSSTGERRRMAQWQLNMRRGKAKKE